LFLENSFKYSHEVGLSTVKTINPVSGKVVEDVIFTANGKVTILKMVLTEQAGIGDQKLTFINNSTLEEIKNLDLY